MAVYTDPVGDKHPVDGEVPKSTMQGNIVSILSKDRLQTEMKDLFRRRENDQTKFSGDVEVAVGANGQQAVIIRGASESGAGSVAGIKAHNYTVKNASSGATPKVTVTPGNHQDFTNGVGTIWTPTINGTLITNPTAPALTVGSSDTVVYFKITVNPLDGSGATPPGQITAIEINSGTSVPAADNTHVYDLCANITVTISGGVATVVSNEGGVTASRGYIAERNWFSSSYSSEFALW